MVFLSHIHPASLVDSATHSPALLELLDLKLSRSVIEYVVDNVIETVDFAMGHPSSSRGRPASRTSQHAKFSTFVNSVIQKAEVTLPILLVTLVYIHRAKPHLQIALEQWANERVFLGALILANKYTNDSTLKNVHWALCTGVFGKRDIGRIEREFLDVLDFELSVSESDILAHHSDIMALVYPRRHQIRSTHIQSPLPPRPVSHWSSDSSDSLSDSSAESSSLPRTPAMDVDHPTSYIVPPVSKHDSHPISTHTSHLHPHQFVDAPTTKEDSHPHRLSSAFNILRSFPIPHFHHHAQPPSSSASSSSSSSATSSSSSSSSSSTNQRGCKPIPKTQIVPARTASVYV